MYQKLAIVFVVSCFISCSDHRTEPYPLNDQPEQETLKINSSVIKKAHFNQFLAELSQPNSRNAFDEKVKNYFPDSVLYNGQDVFGHEIPFKDPLKIIFFENSGAETEPSNVHLASFSTEGNTIDIIRLKEVSYDGSIAVNYLDDQVFEIEYFDFYPKGKSPRRKSYTPYALPTSRRSRKSKIVEEFFYEYFRVDDQGNFTPLRGPLKINTKRKYPQASCKILSTDELAQYSVKELRKMKHEIYAEHGLIFTDNEFRRYFRKKKWYKARNEKIYYLLNDIELTNLVKIETILK